MKILSHLWSYGAGLGSGYVIWILATHAALTCSQKSCIILLSILVLVMFLVAMTIRGGR